MVGALALVVELVMLTQLVAGSAAKGSGGSWALAEGTRRVR